jgi:hypothetical protein
MGSFQNFYILQGLKSKKKKLTKTRYKPRDNCRIKTLFKHFIKLSIDLIFNHILSQLNLYI